MTAPSPVPAPGSVRVRPGPALLAGVSDGPSLLSHRTRYGDVPDRSLAELLALLDAAAVRGRGGAGFPFVTKLRTVAVGRRRAVLVVNLAEGEPASAKDHALAVHRPHLVLDGVRAVAGALGTRDVHVVAPGDRPTVEAALRLAGLERPTRSERFRLHTAAPRFVAGQSSAVLDLLAGRDGLPTTTWVSSAQRGHRGRPTLLANAETWAQVGLLALRGHEAFASFGTAAEPGTMLLTLAGTGGGHEVVEVPFGTPLATVLGPRSALPALVGGFHGTWATASHLATARVTLAHGRDELPLGAGVVLSLASGECPGDLTRRVTRYLAGQSAGTCGPCVNGLPALSSALDGSDAPGARERISRLADAVDGRGACAHPDGTARLVRSLVARFPSCVTHHRGPCPVTTLERVG